MTSSSTIRTTGRENGRELVGREALPLIIFHYQNQPRSGQAGIRLRCPAPNANASRLTTPSARDARQVRFPPLRGHFRRGQLFRNVPKPDLP
jgi:hypothetical protein